MRRQATTLQVYAHMFEQDDQQLGGCDQSRIGEVVMTWLIWCMRAKMKLIASLPVLGGGVTSTAQPARMG
jgi:hypothetical protein